MQPLDSGSRRRQPDTQDARDVSDRHRDAVSTPVAAARRQRAVALDRFGDDGIRTAEEIEKVVGTGWRDCVARVSAATGCDSPIPTAVICSRNSRREGCDMRWSVAKPSLKERRVGSGSRGRAVTRRTDRARPVAPGLRGAARPSTGTGRRSVGASGGNRERPADLTHARRTEPADPPDQARLLNSLHVVEIDSRLVLQPSAVPTSTSLGAPRIVDVIGATMTVCRRPMTSWRVITSTGRRCPVRRRRTARYRLWLFHGPCAFIGQPAYLVPSPGS